MSSFIHIFSDFIPLWLLPVFGFLVALAITYVSVPSIVTVATRKDLCAKPNGRTSHRNATPLLGGISIFAGFILSTTIIAGEFFMLELLYIIAGLIIIMIVGLKDDMINIHPYSKLAYQLIAILLISVLADIRINSFHGLFGLWEIPYFVSIIVTLFVFVVIINGINLIDGIDGLASGLSILISSVLGFWFWKMEHITYAIMSFALAGSLVAFFRYNVFSRKNKIFMGDTGSLIIGFIIAILTTRFLQLNLLAEGNLAIQSAPAVAVGILVIPLFDSLRVFVIRIRKGKSPFSADRQHIHHRLLQLGMTHLQATLTLVSVNLLYVLMCYFMQWIGILWLMAIIIFTSSALSHLLVSYCNKKSRKVIDVEYLTVEKIKAVKKIHQLYGFQPKIPSLATDSETKQSA